MPADLPEPYQVFDCPLAWHTQGLRETASGYGKQLTSRRCVLLPNGRIRRVYITIYGNAGSAWIFYNKQKAYLRDTD